MRWGRRRTSVSAETGREAERRRARARGGGVAPRAGREDPRRGPGDERWVVRARSTVRSRRASWNRIHRAAEGFRIHHPRAARGGGARPCGRRGDVERVSSGGDPRARRVPCLGPGPRLSAAEPGRRPAAALPSLAARGAKEPRNMTALIGSGGGGETRGARMGRAWRAREAGRTPEEIPSERDGSGRETLGARSCGGEGAKRAGEEGRQDRKKRGADVGSRSFLLENRRSARLRRRTRKNLASRPFLARRAEGPFRASSIVRCARPRRVATSLHAPRATGIQPP